MLNERTTLYRCKSVFCAALMQSVLNVIDGKEKYPKVKFDRRVLTQRSRQSNIGYMKIVQSPADFMQVYIKVNRRLLKKELQCVICYAVEN